MASSADRRPAASTNSTSCWAQDRFAARRRLSPDRPGAEKTTIALQYLDAACRRGEPSTVYEFDERIGTLMARATAFNIDLQAHIDAGCLVIQQIDPAEIPEVVGANRFTPF